MYIDYCEDCRHKNVCQYTIEKEKAEKKLKHVIDQSDFNENDMFSVGLICSSYEETIEAKFCRGMYQTDI